MKDIRTLVERGRSYRRFDQSKGVDRDMLEYLVDLARQTPSARNGQTLKYIIVNTPEQCQRIFPSLKWAGYLTDWPGPSEGERPTAYIVVLHDKQLGALNAVDAGIATQTINLGAVEKGLGTCIVAAVDREQLAQSVGLDTERFAIVHVVAIGTPVEEVRMEPMQNGEIKYWRDEQGVHHVPKRELKEVVVK